MNRAKTLTKDQRREIIMSYEERDLHKLLKELFQVMEPNYAIEITHGNQEYGKDLVMVKSDKFAIETIGVVVKCGSIRGKTSGRVDELKSRTKTALSKGDKNKLREIKSQIEQTLSHSAEMKSIFEKLPVSKVYVVIAGDFSNNARRRLTDELAAEVEIFDLDWLINKFTEFYPEVFFEAQVINFLQKKITYLEENHRRGKSGKNLSEYFVNPLIRPLGAPLEFDGQTLRKIRKNRRLPFSRLLEISKKQKKLILSGDPGTGKTGAMTKLAIDSYKEAHKYSLKKTGKSDEKIFVPILVHSREFLKLETAEGLLTSYFGSEETKNRFNVDLIMVDGLDEIDHENRHNIIGKLDEFSEEINCAYILTTRKIDLTNTLPEKYAKYELLPFEFGQALKLVSKLISNKKILETMRESLEKIQAQILLAPLSLMLLIELVEEVEEHEEIPASITELYDRFFDMVLGREDKEKGIEILFEYLMKKKFLGELAYQEFWSKNRFEIPYKDFKAFLNSYALKYGWSPERLSGFVGEIERAGILNQRDEIIFKHRSFLDYFAAFHVHETRGTFLT